MATRLVKRQLQFRPGLAATPVKRDAGQGVLDAQNVILSPDGGALMPLPGYRRVYPYNLLQGDAYKKLSDGSIIYSTTDPGAGYVALTAGLRVVTVPAAAFGLSTGIGLAVVDEASGRVCAVGWHPGGLGQDPMDSAAVLPIVQARLFARTATDWPNIISGRGKTLIVVPGDSAQVWDGTAMRDAGILDPRFPPLFTASNAVPTTSAPQFVIGIKYIGNLYSSPYTAPGFAYDWTRNVLLFWADTSIPGTVTDTVALTSTWTAAVAAVNALHSGQKWVAMLGNLVAGSARPDALTTSAASAGVADVLGVAVTSRGGALLPLKVADSTVAFRVEYSGANATATVAIDPVTAKTCVLTDGSAHSFDLTNVSYDTFAELIAGINLVSGWAARIESATGTDTVVGGSSIPNVVTSGNAKVFGGYPVTINTGQGIGSVVTPSVTKGPFPLTVTFAFSPTQTPTKRTINYGDGTSETLVGSGITASRAHTYTGDTDANKNADFAAPYYTFHVSVTEEWSGGVGSPALVDIVGYFQNITLALTAPDHLNANSHYQWPSDVSTLKNNDTATMNFDFLTWFACKTIWAEPIYYVAAGTDALAATYGDIHVIVNKKPTLACELFQFKIPTASQFTLDPTMSYVASTPFDPQQTQWGSRKGANAVTPERYLLRASRLSTDNMSWQYPMTHTAPLRGGYDTQLGIRLYNVNGSTGVKTLIADIRGINLNTYLGDGDGNKLYFNPNISGVQTVTDVVIGFVGVPKHWRKVDGRDQEMRIVISSIVIHDTRWTAQ